MGQDTQEKRASKGTTVESADESRGCCGLESAVTPTLSIYCCLNIHTKDAWGGYNSKVRATKGRTQKNEHCKTDGHYIIVCTRATTPRAAEKLATQNAPYNCRTQNTSPTLSSPPEEGNQDEFASCSPSPQDRQRCRQRRRSRPFGLLHASFSRMIVGG